MITPAQIGIIHAAKGWAVENLPAFDDDAYRDVLKLVAGVRSSTKLDNDGCTRVLAWFEAKGFKNTAKQPRSPLRRDPNAIVTGPQRALVRALERDLGWSDEPKRLEGFCEKVIGKRRPTTRSDARAVIEGLKAMLSKAAVKSAQE